ncbi:DUF2829 domain-containing protein (plasmid) [Bacillus velezensis]|uniref:Thoeris anti-defense Tad2 family protein n=1 Tax=Bacillus velezensis TaxID=492670 RepID=UPI0019594441|nr:MW1434 family type I TA system toxin [Bacillus velezensis]QRV11330.1 DUF2829 domain-containing protein [Bacillus velezensis]
MAKYQDGDLIAFKNATIIPASTALEILTFASGEKATIIGVSSNEYIIKREGSDTNLSLSHIMVDGVAEKVIAVDNKRYSSILQKGLTFGRAIDKALCEGKKVSREVWDGYWCKQTVDGQMDENLPDWRGEFLVAALKDGGYAIATPYQEDMFANDWMIVE